MSFRLLTIHPFSGSLSFYAGFSWPPAPTPPLGSTKRPYRPLFENLVWCSKSRKEGADYVEITSSLFSYFRLYKSKYPHILESLFNNILGLTVAVLLTTVFFSSYLSSLHKFKKLKRTVFKDLWLKYKYFRLKSPKYKVNNREIILYKATKQQDLHQNY